MTKTAPDKHTLPTLALLLLTNLIPIYLVLFDQWTVAQMVLLFWLENVIIGIMNVLKMRTCQPNKRPRSKHNREMTTFFMIHYGGFTFGHGIFVIAFFFFVEFDYGTLASPYTFSQVITDPNLWWTMLALLISHGFSYYWHFFKGGERMRETTDSLFFKPYARVVVLHITIIGGAWLAASLKQPIWALLVLVFLKILVDMGSHYSSHKKPLLFNK